MYIFSKRIGGPACGADLSRDQAIVSYQLDRKSVLMARATAHDGEHDTISSKSVRMPTWQFLRKPTKIISLVNCITFAAIISR
jgi:hypothetical protein